MSNDGHTLEDFADEMHDLEHGLEQERLCLEFFKQAAGQVTHVALRELYAWFSNAASTRIAGLEAIRAVAAESQSWNEGLAEEIMAVDAEAGDAPQFEDVESEFDRADITSLQQAATLEKQVASVYYTAIRRSRQDSIREFWQYLAPTEYAHINLLDSYLAGIMKAMKEALRQSRN